VALEDEIPEDGERDRLFLRAAVIAAGGRLEIPDRCTRIAQHTGALRRRNDLQRKQVEFTIDGWAAKPKGGM
jgi:hypothetical protein